MPTTRIATWNVARPKARSYKRRPAIESAIRDVNADVWILTETHSSLSPGKNYLPVSSSGFDRPQDQGESWVTIWSRLDIIGTPATRDSKRTACAVVQTNDGRPLIIYGTVLPWLGSQWKDVPAANGAAFSAALDEQRSDWSNLRRDFPDADLCVAGDLNQDLQTKHHYGSAANRSALLNALSSQGLTSVTAGDRDPVARMTNQSWASIDHICLGERSLGGVSGVDAWPNGAAPDKSLSDHFGVWVDVSHA